MWGIARPVAPGGGRGKEDARTPRRVLSVVGTRPEAIKMAPVARAFAGRPRIDHRVVLTGQHAGLDGFFPGAAPIALGCDPSGTTAPRLRERLHRKLSLLFERERPELVLVHGDTASAVAGAFAARDGGIPIGHVEAGLRSFDLRQPWPEEGNRIAIDALSTLLFAPTETAARNLAAEWRVKGQVFVTGNTGIDALLHAAARLGPLPPAPVNERRTILVTCHRKENQGDVALALCRTFKRLVRELPVRLVLALHSNPQVRAPFQAQLGGVAHIELLEPLEYEAMVACMAASWAILTDSGGLQEEGPALGKPVLVLRSVTERPEALACGSLELVGTDPDRIVAAVGALIEDPLRYARMAEPAFPFGDGKAAQRIVAAVEAWLRLSPPPASTARPAAPGPRARPPAAR